LTLTTEIVIELGIISTAKMVEKCIVICSAYDTFDGHHYWHWCSVL